MDKSTRLALITFLVIILTVVTTFALFTRQKSLPKSQQERIELNVQRPALFESRGKPGQGF